jgi:hypothetical protein
MKIRDKHVVNHDGIEKVYCQKTEDWTLLVTCAQCENCKGYNKNGKIVQCQDIEFK